MTGDAAGVPELVALIAGRIAATGPIPFARFMELALYHPTLGYYRRSDAEHPTRRDFRTSPETSPMFGHLIARQLLQIWEALGHPAPFVIVEFGGGSGTLARQILDGLAADSAGIDASYHLIDFVAGDVPGIAWHRPDEAHGISGAHVVLSNEFFDALPVHRVSFAAGGLREHYVDWRRGQFVETLGPPSSPALMDWLLRRGPPPPDGWVGEVSLEIDRWVDRVGSGPRPRAILTIDYGYDSGEFYAPEHRAGTLLAYFRQQWGDDLLARVGRQDLTSHVDFGALIRAGLRHGFQPAGLTDQRRFLRALMADPGAPVLQLVTSAARHWQARYDAAELTRRDGLGRLKVLLQGRDLTALRLAGADADFRSR